MATYTWNGSSGDINSASQWTTTDGPAGSVPGPDDVALIAGGTISGDSTLGFVVMQGDTTLTGHMTAIGASATFYALTAFNVGGGTTTFSGVGAGLTADKDSIVGGSISGSLDIINGASAEFHTSTVDAPQNGLYLGYSNGITGNALFSGSGTTIDSDSGIAVGYSGIGTLTVSDDATLTMEAANNFGFYIAYNNGSTGTFNLESGATVSGTAFADIGANAGSTGQATIDGVGTKWTQTEDIAVGFGGSGTLTVENQAAIQAGALASGVLDNSTGNLTTLESGATADVNELDLGLGVDSEATLTVIGADGSVPNTTLTVANNATVGGSGSATFNIEQGGAASIGVVDIGTASTGSGVVTVEGQGSLLAANQIGIGGSTAPQGSGDVAATDGGAVTVSQEIDLWSGGTLSAASGGSVEVGTTADAATAGAIQVDTGGLIIGDGLIEGALVNNGEVVAFTPPPPVAADAFLASSAAPASEGLVIDGNVTGDGTLEIAPGGSLEVTGTVDSAQQVLFEQPTDASGGGNLIIDDVTDFAATINGMTAGDTIDLTGVQYDADGSINLIANNVLDIFANGTDYTLQLDQTQDFGGAEFHFAADGTNPDAGTLISETVACYCRGTLIATDRGEVEVERLGIGDRLQTAQNGLRPIKWIGRRSYRGRFVMGRRDILPICFKAGSLGDNVPRRDLWISPHHAMYLQGVLIEAGDLVNGVSIVQADRVEKVEYFHIELDGHDVILAEGALSETFVDDDSRGMFHNAHEYDGLYPETERVPARYCAPRRAAGYEVETARRHIETRAGLRAAQEAGTSKIRGFVDIVSANHVAGWAQNIDHPEAPVCLDILAGDQLIGRVLANRYREDLQRAGLGSGRHSFEFITPAGSAMVGDAIRIRRSLDQASLGLSNHAGHAPLRGSYRTHAGLRG